MIFKGEASCLCLEMTWTGSPFFILVTIELLNNYSMVI